MNRLLTAIKAFWKILKTPEDAKLLLHSPSSKQDFFDPSHIRLLSMLQQSGRLIDFLKEDIAGLTDAQVGAAVRTIHADCSKHLEEVVTIRPLMEEQEGAKIKVLPGYDPSKMKVTGKVKGEPPFEGILIHKGWKAHKQSLPKKTGLTSQDIIYPAEVEVR